MAVPGHRRAVVLAVGMNNRLGPERRRKRSAVDCAVAVSAALIRERKQRFRMARRRVLASYRVAVLEPTASQLVVETPTDNGNLVGRGEGDLPARQNCLSPNRAITAVQGWGLRYKRAHRSRAGHRPGNAVRPCLGPGSRCHSCCHARNYDAGRRYPSKSHPTLTRKAYRSRPLYMAARPESLENRARRTVALLSQSEWTDEPLLVRRIFRGLNNAGVEGEQGPEPNTAECDQVPAGCVRTQPSANALTAARRG
jgi:hypothetical protein